MELKNQDKQEENLKKNQINYYPIEMNKKVKRNVVKLELRKIKLIYQFF